MNRARLPNRHSHGDDLGSLRAQIERWKTRAKTHQAECELLRMENESLKTHLQWVTDFVNWAFQINPNVAKK